MLENLTSDSILLILKLLATLFMLIGLFSLILELLGMPTSLVRKNIMVLSKSAISKPSSFDVIVNKISSRIQRFIKIDELKRNRMVNEFEVLSIKLTPEQYYGNAIAKGIIIACFAPLGLVLHWGLSIFILLIAVLIFLLEYNSVDKIIKERKSSIERELTKFVSVIEQTFKNEHNVVKLLEDYVSTDDSPLTKELRIVLADMKTGSYEMALNKFSNRINSTYVSETCRGLLGALRGDNTVSYFETLNIKLWEAERARIKKEAMKSPKKVKYLVSAMMSCMMLIYIVVFATVIVDGLGDVFSVM